MFVSTFVKEMNFIGSRDGDGGIDGNIGDSYPDDAFMVIFEVLDLSL